MAIVKKYAKELYAKEVVMKAAYMFTDCAYLHLDVDTENYLISMQSKTNESEETLLNRFENELIVQQARYSYKRYKKYTRNDSGKSVVFNDCQFSQRRGSSTK